MGRSSSGDEKTVKARGVSAQSDSGRLSPLLVVIHGHGLNLGQRFELDEAGSVIGRHSSADVQLDVDSLSRNHAMVYRSEEGWYIEDLGSTNGVRVNDVEIETEVIENGDVLRLGDVILKFLAGKEIEAAYQETIYRLSSFDTLTGCYNRRHFLELLERELVRAGRADTATGVVVVDVDEFGDIKEAHGNLAGDDVLCALAARIRSRVRRDDFVARYGEDEFTFALANADSGGAARFAEEVRRLVAEEPFVRAGVEIEVTVSAGVAVREPSEELGAEELVERAIDDLRRAQEAGRNRVCS